MTTYNEPGPCRKACPCGIWVPARVKACPMCNHAFEKKGKKAAESKTAVARLSPAPVREPTEACSSTAPETEAGTRKPTWHNVVAFAGRCPIDMGPVTRSGLTIWVRKVQDWAHANNDQPLPSAYHHFGNQFHPISTPEHEAMHAILDEIVGSDIPAQRKPMSKDERRALENEVAMSPEDLEDEQDEEAGEDEEGEEE